MIDWDGSGAWIHVNDVGRQVSSASTQYWILCHGVTTWLMPDGRAHEGFKSTGLPRHLDVYFGDFPILPTREERESVLKLS
jgi:hypothetical protein